MVNLRLTGDSQRKGGGARDREEERDEQIETEKGKRETDRNRQT